MLLPTVNVHATLAIPWILWLGCVPLVALKIPIATVWDSVSVVMVTSGRAIVVFLRGAVAMDFHGMVLLVCVLLL